IVAQGAWVAFRAVFLTGPAADQQVDTPLGFGALAQEIFKFLPGAVEVGSSSVLQSTPGVVLTSTLGLVVVGGVIGLLFSSESGSTEARLSTSTLVVALIAAPVLAVVTTAAA